MDDVKYLMLPRIDETPKTTKHHPWYKERLRTKFISKATNKEKLLDAKQWTFVKDGLDDFRDGKPPPQNEVLIKPAKGPAPNVKNKEWSFKQSVVPQSQRFNVQQRCYSKVLPMVESKKERIDQLIYGLTQHPLALYPHIEESLPTDLFEEIVDILDPEMAMANSSFNGESEMNLMKSHSALTSISSKTRENSSKSNDLKKSSELIASPQESYDTEDDENSGFKNTYKWLLRKEEAKEKSKGADHEDLKAQAIDKHIKHVTEDFCNWISGLGGENNIDPVTLTSLFASGHETKPALSVPIHVVELTNIPPELRHSANVSSLNEKMSRKNIPDNDDDKLHGKPKNRYGAWYLSKELWKIMPSDQKLIDPKFLVDKDQEEANKKTEEMNAKICPLHGTKSFKEFVQYKKPSRHPKMIAELDDWEKQQAIKAALLEAARLKELKEQQEKSASARTHNKSS